MPDNVAAVGALVGDTFASATTLESNGISVLLQPNYLPLRVRIHMHWHTSGSRRELELPRLVNATESDVLRSVHINDDETWVAEAVGSPERNQAAVAAETWSKTLGTAVGAASSLKLPERESWLAGWHPRLIGLSRNVQVSNIERIVASNASTTQPPTVGVEEFWTSVCERLQIDPTRVNERASKRFEYQQPQYRQRDVLGLPQQTFALSRVDEAAPGYAWRLAAAGAVLLVVVVTMRFGGVVQSVYVQLLSVFPWVYWLQLAILTWILVPNFWPGAVLAFTALAMGVGQYSDYRRTSHLR
jgi:hypothetical protein